ncbi:MAG TPA: GTP cyclohydrolase I FolE [Candidatus Limnocylindria bacterium]|jgi:GTP cyclohydrolase I|nr:GTP cyclohydrolase I FolE [Candidatus Limnocylindria bacterium]
MAVHRLRDLDDEDQPQRVDEKTRRVALAFHAVLEALELDRSDPDLAGTDLRVARMYRELFAGLERDEPRLRTFPNREGYSEMVTVLDIPFYSLCAHHFLPFFGSAHVGYIPSDRIVGLSKIARVVDHYARRPQLQERMTEQILGLLRDRLQPRGVMVVLQGRHLCMEMRGVSKPRVVTTTSAIAGAFDEDKVRQEFLALLPSRESG